jgi:molecular chaperone GrpE
MSTQEKPENPAPGAEAENGAPPKQESPPEKAVPPEAEAEATDAEAEGVEAEAEAEAAPAEEKKPEDEIAELKDKLLRALADNQNTIRRARKEREDTAKYATANMARDILTVADNLRRALEAIPDELRSENDLAKGLIDGVQLTERELLATLERHGIRKIDPIGEKFDHNFHQAMFEVPTSDAEPGTVVQVIQRGYTIHDRLLRAAQVGIAKAVPESGEEEHQVDTTV